MENVIIVGEKNFGVSNGQIYTKHKEPDYFDQYIDVDNPQYFIVRNTLLKKQYGDRYIDLMSMVINDKQQVRVFTPDHHFISADCRHLSKGGAIFFSQRIDLKEYLK